MTSDDYDLAFPHGHDEVPSPTPPTGPRRQKWRIGAAILTGLVFAANIGLFILSIWGREEGSSPSAPSSASSSAASSPAVAGPARPSVIYGTTPAELTVEGWANIEVDAPILMYYPSEATPVRLVPGNPCRELRAPKYSGPKRFVSEKDPKAGRISFRAYPVEKGCS